MTPQQAFDAATLSVNEFAKKYTIPAMRAMAEHDGPLFGKVEWMSRDELKTRYFNPAPLREIPGGYMKEETLAAFEVGQKSLAEALYDAAFAEGKASVEISADLADLQLKLAEAQAEIAKVKSDDEADKAAIAEGHAKLEAIKAILVPAPKVEAPVDPVIEGEAQP